MLLAFWLCKSLMGVGEVQDGVEREVNFADKRLVQGMDGRPGDQRVQDQPTVCGKPALLSLPL